MTELLFHFQKLIVKGRKNFRETIGGRGR